MRTVKNRSKSKRKLFRGGLCNSLKKMFGLSAKPSTRSNSSIVLTPVEAAELVNSAEAAKSPDQVNVLLLDAVKKVQNENATKIQKNLRRLFTRTALKNENENATKIQNLVRKNQLSRKKNATTIQKLVRGYKSRENFVKSPTYIQYKENKKKQNDLKVNKMWGVNKSEQEAANSLSGSIPSFDTESLGSSNLSSQGVKELTSEDMRKQTNKLRQKSDKIKVGPLPITDKLKAQIKQIKQAEKKEHEAEQIAAARKKRADARLNPTEYYVPERKVSPITDLIQLKKKSSN